MAQEIDSTGIPAGSPESCGSPSEELRVLVVEDSEDDVLLLRRRELRRCGYRSHHRQVQTARQMEAALDEEEWDVVISDHSMPRFSAPEALAVIKQRGLDLPFIILSGRIGESIAVAAMKAGAHDYIVKGDLARLSPAIERELREAAVRRENRRADEELRRSEERYRTVVEQTVSGIFLLAAETGAVVEANAAFQSMLGYTADELLAMKLYDFVLTGGHNGTPAREEFESFTGERAYRCRDGSVVEVEVGVSAVRHRGRELLCFVNHDITERKRSEAALRSAEEKYRGIFENALEGIFQSKADGTLATANPAFLRMFGYGVGEELPDVRPHYANPERREEFLRRIREDGEVSDFEVEGRRRDGSVIWFSVNARALPSGTPGGETYFEGICQDITERKQVSESLRRNLEVMLALYEAGGLLGSSLKTEEIGSRLLGLMQRVSSLTAAAIRLPDGSSGCSTSGSASLPDALLPWATVGPKRTWRTASRTPAAREALRRAVETREPQTFRLPETAGSKLPPVGLCLPLRVRDRVIGALEAYGPPSLLEREPQDFLSSLAGQAASALENARLYEELAEHEAQLAELVGKLLLAQEEERHRVAYDVHDGLAQMVAASYQNLQAFTLHYPQPDPEVHQELEAILEMLRSTVGEARRIIADLRPMTLDDFGLGASVRQHVEALRAEGWQVDYRENLGEIRLPVGTETALFRVVQEALTNVRKHAQTRAVGVTLQRRNGEISLEVSDRGRGFSPASLAAEPAAPGQRIGLSGMRERTALMGGKFEVHSRPGYGTRVVVRVPESRVVSPESPG